MSEIVLETPVYHDDHTKVVEELFGLAPEKVSRTVIQDNIELPEKWNVFAILGASGSGKSTLLKEFGEPDKHVWDHRPIISHFTDISPQEATELLSAVGFSTVPAWLRPYSCLSVGEQFRADLARTLSEPKPIYVVDEFVAALDRNVAKAACNSLQKYIRRTGKKLVVASSHLDVIEFLSPDAWYIPQEGVMHTASENLCRPPISLEIIRVKQSAWELFRKYHFLNTEKLNQGSRCFMALWDGVPVAFASCLAHPHPTLPRCWRSSRIVCNPDFQGLGIGVRLSDYVASMASACDCNFYARTAHPAMIAYRRNSPNWEETTTSKRVKRAVSDAMKGKGWEFKPRETRCFKYVGPASSGEQAKLFHDDKSWAQPKKRKKYRLGMVDDKGQIIKS